MLPKSDVPTNRHREQRTLSTKPDENFGDFTKGDLGQNACEIFDNADLVGYEGIVVGKGVRAKVRQYIQIMYARYRMMLSN